MDVARMGMVAMYFRTPDGGTGYAERAQGGGWAYRRAASSADEQRIRSLFDALEKQIRVGWFEVPNVLPEVR